MQKPNVQELLDTEMTSTNGGNSIKYYLSYIASAIEDSLTPLLGLL